MLVLVVVLVFKKKQLLVLQKEYENINSANGIYVSMEYLGSIQTLTHIAD